MKMLIAAMPLLLLGCSSAPTRVVNDTPTVAEQEAFKQRLMARLDYCSGYGAPHFQPTRATCSCMFDVTARTMTRTEMAGLERYAAGRPAPGDARIADGVRPRLDSEIARSCGVTQ